MKEKTKKIKIQRIGIRKILLICLWSLFAVAFVFAVYKNFTGIDTHTIYETKIVEQKIFDTSNIESFVGNFAKQFYAWQDTKESIDSRQIKIGNYLTDDLINLNKGIITDEQAVSSSLSDFNIWRLEKIDDNTFEVTYSVTQKITKTIITTEKRLIEETQVKEVKDKDGKVTYKDEVVQKEIEEPIEKKEDSTVENCYIVTVHVDDNKDMVIVRNPSVTSKPQKSSYTVERKINTNPVGSEISKELDIFFEKFFEIYPKADQTELDYYVRNEALPIIKKDLEFKKVSSVYEKAEDDKITARVTVTYDNIKTGVTELSQYTLQLEKNDNWSIVGSEMYK